MKIRVEKSKVKVKCELGKRIFSTCDQIVPKIEELSLENFRR